MTPEWSVKGEGRANVVFEYRGSDSDRCGKVLRVAKKRQIELEPGAEELEKELWYGTALTDKTTRLEKNVAYVQSVIGPKLGQHFIEHGTIVDVPCDLCVRHEVECQGWLLSDSTVFAKEEVNGWRGRERVLSLEMKPKCGFIPDAKTIDPSNTLKKNTPRFLLHQFLKLKQGRVQYMSDYSPLELFSENVPQMKHALLKLMQTPQNNLALFVDGKRLPVTEEGLMNTPVFLVLQEVLYPLLTHQNCESLAVLLTDLVAKVLLKEGILKKILAIQKLDRYDIEGVYPLYCHLRDQRIRHAPKQEAISCRWTHAPDRLSTDRNRRTMCLSCLKAQESLKQLSVDAQLRLLRDWLIATTAKDCSIFLTFCVVQSRDGDERVSTKTRFPHSLKLEDSNIKLLYKIQICDLDLKPLSKIPYQFQLDQHILTAAEKYRDVNSV